MERRKLNKMETGLNYENRSFMVAGYIDDYELTYDPDILGELGDPHTKLTVNDFEENRGYVDNAGFVYIFRKTPDKSEIIPWFTVVMDNDGKPKLEFNQKRTEALRKAFRIERVGDLSVKRIIEETSEDEVPYDDDEKNEFLSASSGYVPEIYDDDDFLKKIVKFMLKDNGCGSHSFKNKVTNSYEVTNLFQGLNGKTKTSPVVFMRWMELNNTDFDVYVKNADPCSKTPIHGTIHYNSKTGTLELIREDGTSDADEKKTNLRSAKQFG